MLGHKSNVEEVAGNKPNAATAYNLPNSATAPARSFNAAYTTGQVITYHATNGTDWEEVTGVFTSGTPGTLSRDILHDSSTGSLIDWSAGADVTIRVEFAANIGEQADLALRAAIPGGRLTLASGLPGYQPRGLIAVTGQDTVNDTITLTAHGWVAGTMVKSDATSGGLASGLVQSYGNGTQYYVGNPETNTITLHTTLADALSGTNKVNITGAVTANIIANGIANTKAYYTPDRHNSVKLWNGKKWITIVFAQTEINFETLTSGTLYDVFGYLNSGVLALELLAWASDSERATAISLQDGVMCKTGDKTRIHLGTILARDTTSVEISYRMLGLRNRYNQKDYSLAQVPGNVSWTYSTAAYRQVGGDTNNKVETFSMDPCESFDLLQNARVGSSTSTFRAVLSSVFINGNNLGSSTLPLFSYPFVNNQAIQSIMGLNGRISTDAIGKKSFEMMEYAAGVDVQTWYGSGYYTKLIVETTW